MDRGKYICLEGGDGSGKSTLAQALWEKIDAPATSYRFPSDGDVGKLIRSGLMGDVVLSDKSYLYLFAADGLNEESRIKGDLARGTHVVCDRHPTLSGRAFQPLHHEAKQIEDVYNAALFDGVSMPDHLFVLEVSAEEAINRMRSRAKYKDVVFEKEGIDHIEGIAKRYRTIARRFGGILLDAHKTTEELVEIILSTTGLA